ncbi:LptF/LptG family permease [Methylosinus sp. Sm6]|uniref:LptF/LptG family permease n=1 Tax=Methylosinus sp. Sm6 TaxID=2866948 RepID=UPI001C99EE50|nr:LptF/LptG family permease [Methylosinus sp. Sm6]MBY6241889.1 LptF/LptG family permease [Methylosinus sp. Sm6]
MPRLLFVYLARRILFSMAVVQFALSVPVVLSYLLYTLTPAAIRAGLMAPALIGTTPTVAYITLPMAIGVATALEFARMSSEGMIAVLYALRLSVWAVCRPAIVCAGAMVLLGYGLANFMAPHYAGALQDVINVVRNTLNHRMLEAARFYTFDNGLKTLYLERWETPDVAVNLFVRQLSLAKNQEETITAARAEFRRTPTGVILALSRGSIQTRPFDADEVRIAGFDEYAMALPMQGSESLPARSWRGVYEMGPREFLDDWSVARLDRRLSGEWAAEAAKRFGMPLLSLAHTLLAMALVLTFGNVTGRRGASSSLVIIAVPAAHIFFLVALETLLRADPRYACLLAALIAAEIAIAVVLISRRNRNASPMRRVSAYEEVDRERESLAA